MSEQSSGLSTLDDPAHGTALSRYAKNSSTGWQMRSGMPTSFKEFIDSTRAI